LALSLTAQAQVDKFFRFDEADETIAASILDNPLFYDAGGAPTTNGLWVAWLEYIPGRGDQLWVGLRQNEEWSFRKQLSEKPGDYANPTPTLDAKGNLWVTYELNAGGRWNVFARQKTSETEFSAPKRHSDGPSINHRIIKDSEGEMLMVKQSGFPDGFRTEVIRFGSNGSRKHAIFFDAGLSSWHPAAALAPDGTLHVVWDDYDGRSYNVLYRSNQGTNWSAPKLIAASPAFEAHAQIVSDSNGKLYVLWEEDGENWGQHYLARTAGDKKSTRMVDNEGPLHRFRRLRLAELDEKNGQLKEFEVPQPCFDLAAQRTDAPPGLKNFGTFYENGQLVVDGQNRPWIVYRHFYVPWIGLTPETHKQDNMRLYARCLLPGGWSKLYTFSEGQGDGMQRISIAPTKNGITVAYTIGRTDRRKGEKHSEKKRGVAIAEIHLDQAEVRIPAQSITRLILKDGSATSRSPRQRPVAHFNGKKYELFFGDLHRHTDISLCYSPCDGTIEDAYRYAIDAAPLDFLGITDHTHDLDMGDGLSLIWHRSRKEVNRHEIAGRFIPFYSYERSRGDTDHNVISLRDDVLRPHLFPLTQFWEQIDTNTFTIPHQPFNAITWNYKDDAHRPLVEIYQGYRNDAREEDARQGLDRGHHVGFIASSDHLSTGGSFACVWATEPTRESLFRAMQGRRTFAATSRIRLKVTCGDHWMGEQFFCDKLPPIEIEVTGTAPLKTVELVVDNQPRSLVEKDRQDSTRTFKIQDAALSTGPHVIYVRVTQIDGNRAWSSPLWVDIKASDDNSAAAPLKK
jgi:hypothetical protein